MYNFKFAPESYFKEGINSVLLVKLHYPESQWGEQISIYAHLLDRSIEFEAVDFYGNDYMLYPQKTEEPLIFEDLIYLIESMQVNTDSLEGNADLVLFGTPEAESEFYQELKQYFDEKRASQNLS